MLQYEKLRKNAVSQLREREKDHKRIDGKRVQAPEADDAFHNGFTILPEILDWFDYLRHALRRSDFVCGQVLNLVRKEMLLKDPNERIKAPDLCKRLRDILVIAEHDLDEQQREGEIKQISPMITEILQDDLQDSVANDSGASQAEQSTDTEAQTFQKFPPPPASDARNLQRSSLARPSSRTDKGPKRIGKSERLERKPLLKTGHRAVQHSQAYSNLTKRSTGHSSISNGTITEEPSIYGSPTEVAKATKKASPDDTRIPPLPPKPEIYVEEPTPTPPLTCSPPTVIVDDPKESVPNERPTLEDRSPSIDNSARSEVSDEKEAAEPIDPYADSEQNPLTELTPVVDLHRGRDPDCFELRKSHPKLEVFQVRDELTAQQLGKVRSFFKSPKQDEYLKGYIKDRDMIFVLDNALSMYSEWGMATFTAETLAMKIGKLDEDGIDYVFTAGQNYEMKTAGGKNPGLAIRNAMDAAIPTADSFTDMTKTLSTIFDRYLARGQRKRMTLLIFTDGAWQAETRNRAVELKIKEFWGQLRKRNEPRWVSIQFIAFGQNRPALSRMQSLDDDFEALYGVP